MMLIGSTAIEDKLQEEVAETIVSLKEAGIKVWVLTGDKVETAINIGYSAGLLNNEITQFVVQATEEVEIQKEFNDIAQQLEVPSGTYALVVAGDTLAKVQESTGLTEKFLEVSPLMEVVIACRVSPK